MKAFSVLVVVVTGVAAWAPAEAHASNGAAGLFSNDLMTGLMMAVGCALFSVLLRRLPN
jgi:hypothetical protein